MQMFCKQKCFLNTNKFPKTQENSTQFRKMQSLREKFRVYNFAVKCKNTNHCITLRFSFHREISKQMNSLNTRRFNPIQEDAVFEGKIPSIQFCNKTQKYEPLHNSQV
jgi:hypothetical protein